MIFLNLMKFCFGVFNLGIGVAENWLSERHFRFGLPRLYLTKCKFTYVHPG